MINILDKSLMSWIGRNKSTFIFVILIGANIYQYVEGRAVDKTREEAARELNQKIRDMNQESIRYERERSERLEYLLNRIAPPPKNEQKDANH